MSSEHDPSVAAEQARQRLHEEIERVRVGVEEMLLEQGGDHDHPELRRELDAIREEAKRYVKKRIGKSEARSLLTYAFAQDIVDRIKVQSLRDSLEKVLFEKFHEHDQ